MTFLNTVDPAGKNLRQLYEDNMNTTVWPQYGPIKFSPSAAAGKHYAVAYPEWAQKPFNFGDFRRGAQFVNSLFNGKVLSKTPSTRGRVQVRHLQGAALAEDRAGHVRHELEETPKRTASTGFVLPSNDEWVKAAYYDPNHGGTDSYWEYPTGPFDQPNISVLNPTTGDVTNADDAAARDLQPERPEQHASTRRVRRPAPAPTWCPSQAGPTARRPSPPTSRRDSTSRRSSWGT